MPHNKNPATQRKPPSSALFAIFGERWRRTAPPDVQADLAGFLDRNAVELAAELDALEDPTDVFGARERNPDSVHYAAWTKRGKAPPSAGKFMLEEPVESPDYDHGDRQAALDRARADPANFPDFDKLLANLDHAREAEAQAGAALSSAQRTAGANALRAVVRYLGPDGDVNAALQLWREEQRWLAEEARSLQNEVDAEYAP